MSELLLIVSILSEASKVFTVKQILKIIKKSFVLLLSDGPQRILFPTGSRMASGGVRKDPSGAVLWGGARVHSASLAPLHEVLIDSP